jgi:inward rectifier potassium channel
VATRKPEPFFDARGRLLIERRGMSRELGSSLYNDAYHFMRSASWRWILLAFVGLFIALNFIFAIALWLDHANVTNVTGFWDYYWFSVQSIATIGYGYFAPVDTFSNVTVVVESLIGIAYVALATGVFFARFSTTQAKVIFSKTALITNYGGKRTLMFRMANARSVAVVEATVRVYVSRDETMPNGEWVRRIHDLVLTRATSPIFALSWTAYHTIDEASPLYNATTESIHKANLNLVVTFQGIDDRLAAAIHTRWAYNMDDIEFDKRYVDILKKDENNVRYLDLEKFHDTEPL